MISAAGLTKTYGDQAVLGGLDLHVPAGTVFGLLGPNGAGKTTTVRILSTLLPADSGTATVGGHDVRTDPDGVRGRIGVTGQFAAADALLTAARAAAGHADREQRLGRGRLVRRDHRGRVRLGARRVPPPRHPLAHEPAGQPYIATR